jgi:hypothetical protein
MNKSGMVKVIFAKVLAVLFALIVTISGAWQISRGAPAGPRAFKVVVGGETFTLAEVDVGARFDCGAGMMVGIVLKDGNGISRWSHNLGDTASFLAIHGCDGISAASVVGVAVPSDDTAVWVIRVLACGASCAGDDVLVFSFHPSRKRFSVPNSIEYASGVVSEELHRAVGLGDVKFAFPRLVLYVREGYKDCPSRWTRLTYEWIKSSNWMESRFILKNSVSYTSPQCSGGPSDRHWPPDPGQ